MTIQKLYTVAVTEMPEGAFDDLGYPVEGWQPEEWLSDPDQFAWWTEKYGDTRFFWPKQDVLYRSRSSAQARANLFESYGAKAEVLVCEPAWQSLADMRAEHSKARKDKRIAKLRAQIAEIEARP